jgi:hypothetical protein
MGRVERPHKISEETIERLNERLSPRDQNIVIASNGRKGKDGASGLAEAAFCAVSLDRPTHLAACGHAVASHTGRSPRLRRRRNLEREGSL